MACENEEGVYEEEYIAIDLVIYRKSLANKNRLLSKLSSRYVSGASYE